MNSCVDVVISDKCVFFHNSDLDIHKTPQSRRIVKFQSYHEVNSLNSSCTDTASCKEQPIRMLEPGTKQKNHHTENLYCRSFVDMKK